MDNEIELRTIRAWWTCEPCGATLSIEVTSNVEAFQPGGAAGELLAAIDETQGYLHGPIVGPGSGPHKLESGRAEALRLL